MAKKSVIERNKKRKYLINKYSEERKKLKAIIKNPRSSDNEFFKAKKRLVKLPKNSSMVRYKNRCSLTGRAHGYYRKFGVSRITFRELASSGDLPGVRRSSW